jgi:two-component system, chemotaxis family, protein-glutamate methylesterase/glutaminase
MPRIRVLVVDDSVVTRKVLCDALSADPEIEIAGTAADGSIALAKLSSLSPDLITLDVEMPGKSGLETLIEIRESYPKLPVIMFSSFTERGANTTLEALSLGASDYVAKPSSSGSVEETRARIQAELIPKAKALCARRVQERKQLTLTGSKEANPQIGASGSSRTALQAIVAWTKNHSAIESRIDVLAIGTSTGGPNALAELLPMLAGDFPVPIVIVQHMPPLFTCLLAERLAKQCVIKIQEGREGEILKAGEAWLAPGDYHMLVHRDGSGVRLALNKGPVENSCRPAVDVLFRSVAKTYGSHCLAVVLTGMGADGTRGARHVTEAGGRVFVQDEETSVVWGMPGAVVTAGLAEGIYPLREIAAAIDRGVRGVRGDAIAVKHGSLGIDVQENNPQSGAGRLQITGKS